MVVTSWSIPGVNQVYMHMCVTMSHQPLLEQSLYPQPSCCIVSRNLLQPSSSECGTVAQPLQWSASGAYLKELPFTNNERSHTMPFVDTYRVVRIGCILIPHPQDTLQDHHKKTTYNLYNTSHMRLKHIKCRLKFQFRRRVFWYFQSGRQRMLTGS